MRTVEQILNEVLLGKNLLGSSNFVEDKLIDSFDLMNIIAVLEDEYEIEIDVDEIDEENFKNVESIKKLVEEATKNNGK